ncbi:hypothetical protein [Fangia hongkongensis]|uniref:hypothetical protein n=3 Tax=Fangia hongkongensis TaxID=270495 RepID=UPI00036159D6|nr:hypothetical protein [Fangia hongkongensis]
MIITDLEACSLLRKSVVEAIELYKCHYDLTNDKKIDNISTYSINFSSHQDNGFYMADRLLAKLKTYKEVAGGKLDEDIEHFSSCESFLNFLDRELAGKKGKHLYSLKTLIFWSTFYIVALMDCQQGAERESVSLSVSGKEIYYKHLLYYHTQVKSLQSSSFFDKRSNHDAVLSELSLVNVSFITVFGTVMNRVIGKGKLSSLELTGDEYIDLDALGKPSFWVSNVDESYNVDKLIKQINYMSSRGVELLDKLPNFFSTLQVLKEFEPSAYPVASKVYQGMKTGILSARHTRVKLKNQGKSKKQFYDRINKLCDIFIGSASAYLSFLESKAVQLPVSIGVDAFMQMAFSGVTPGAGEFFNMITADTHGFSASPRAMGTSVTVFKFTGPIYYGSLFRGDPHTNIGRLRVFDMAFYAASLKKTASLWYVSRKDESNQKTVLLDYIDPIINFFNKSGGQKKSSYSQLVSIGLLEFLIQHSESTQFNKYKGDYQKFNKEVLHGEDRKSLITAIKGTIDTRFDSITLHESRYRIRHGLGVDV